jgi:glycyl-tRNA synthetase
VAKTLVGEKMANNRLTLDQLVALCKQRGFIFQSAEIYGGLNGVYDFGPLGTLLKQNIKKVWLKNICQFEEDVVQLDGSILGSKEAFTASGHIGGFSDPMIDCMNCKKRFREDDVDVEKPCSCGIKKWTSAREFNLMFQTQLGAMSDNTSVAYLRPETAQSVFINFKNVCTSTRVKVPFGIAQIGKAFRNEITPKQFLFRMREFEQMELEFFCHPDKADKYFDLWLERRKEFYNELGINQENLRMHKQEGKELAHYSKCCTDFEYNFPFGWKELEGVANRGDYDLSKHIKHSGKDLSYFDASTNLKFVPHVIECSVGVDRLMLMTLFDAYREEEIEGEKRVVLSISPKLAPIQIAVLPLVKKISEPALKIFKDLKRKGFSVQFDESGSIGKRYRRQDEIGTPLCITFDFDSLEDNKVTVRNRDTLEQTRISIDTAAEFCNKFIFEG